MYGPHQPPSIIMPATYYAPTDTEVLSDLLEHTSIEFRSEYLVRKEIHVLATEVIAVPGVPGNLWLWVELSPFPSINTVEYPAPLGASTLYWAAIGGGGGALAPVAPVIEVATGVTGTVHTLLLPWGIHSSWARLVVQVPVAAAPATAFWAVQAIISAKAP